MSEYVRVTHPDEFEQIVGVPLDDWIAANTVEALKELLATRDAPVETLDQHEATCVHSRVEVVTYASAEPVTVLCDCGATFRKVGQ